MKIIKPTYEIMTPIDPAHIMSHLERVCRTCYKSENKICDGSAEKLLANIIKSGHEAMLEHYSFSVRFIVDRGVSHEIVRHRMASYAQESTRYCNYSKDKFGSEITFVEPPELNENLRFDWQNACACAEELYFEMLNDGARPEIARDVLPTSVKTEIVMTANIREWRHFLRLRTSPSAHPQIRQVAIPLLLELKEKLPVLFGDI